MRVLERSKAQGDRGVDHSPDQPAVEPRAFVRRTSGATTADEPAVTRAPMLTARQSIALNNSAHTTEEINR